MKSTSLLLFTSSSSADTFSLVIIIAEDIDTHRHYAIKREPLDTPFSQLRHESIMYDVLAGGRKCCPLPPLPMMMMVTHVMLLYYHSWYSPMPVVWRTR